MSQVTAERKATSHVFYPVTVTPEERIKGKGAILAVLARAAEDSEFLAKLAENPEEALAGYYTLTQEEVAALISGDIKKIEGWLGKLDKKHATWLWCRLQQEKW
jgi:hypothetical protein